MDAPNSTMSLELYYCRSPALCIMSEKNSNYSINFSVANDWLPPCLGIVLPIGKKSLTVEKQADRYEYRMTDRQGSEQYKNISLFQYPQTIS